jgi:Mg2+/citrate symporter
MTNKPWYKSKTVWLNTALTVAGVATLVADQLSRTPQMDAPGVLMVAAGIAGVVIRIWFTNSGIGTPPAA